MFNLSAETFTFEHLDCSTAIFHGNTKEISAELHFILNNAHIITFQTHNVSPMKQPNTQEAKAHFSHHYVFGLWYSL